MAVYSGVKGGRLENQDDFQASPLIEVCPFPRCGKGLGIGKKCLK